jgi:hypothetical protein
MEECSVGRYLLNSQRLLHTLSLPNILSGSNDLFWRDKMFGKLNMMDYGG